MMMMMEEEEEENQQPKENEEGGEGEEKIVLGDSRVVLCGCLWFNIQGCQTQTHIVKTWLSLGEPLILIKKNSSPSCRSEFFNKELSGFDTILQWSSCLD